MKSVQDKATPAKAAVAFFITAAATVLVPQHLLAGDVLVYLANETAPVGKEAENYSVVSAWLRSSALDKHRQIAEQLDTDRQEFAPAIDAEIAALVQSLPSHEEVGGAIIFTNRLARQDQCHVWKAGFREFFSEALAVPHDENYILEANPLSRLQVFEQALKTAAQHFDPRQHTFVLIAKSHGSTTRAITPRLVVRAEETTREELLQVASGGPIDEEPAWAGRLGISKADFLAALKRAGDDYGMRFSLVFLEACNAATGELDADRLPSNVDQLLLVREKTDYRNLSYETILARLGQSGNLADAILTDLPGKFVVHNRTANRSSVPFGSQLPLWLYFAPLALWATWLAWNWKRRQLRWRHNTSASLGEQSCRE